MVFLGTELVSVVKFRSSVRVKFWPRVKGEKLGVKKIFDPSCGWKYRVYVANIPTCRLVQRNSS